MSDQEPRLCLVGAGALSSRRIYPYIGAAGAQIAGICDLDGQKAATNARRFGGTPYTDMDVMLKEQSPDGVIICVGPEVHAELAVKMMRMGIPVYTEKPPAPSAEEAFEVARVSKETGVLCSTAFKKRYTTCYSRAREWLDGFGPKDVMSIGVDYASAYYTNETPRGSFLLDFAVHIIDLTAYLMGDATEVFAFTQDHHAYAVSIRFANGAVGSLNLNDGRSFTIPTEEIELTVKGGNWMSIHNSSSWKMVKDGQPSEWREPSTFTSGGDSGNDTGHLAEIADFVAAIQEGRSTRSNIYESYKSMVLYQAILQSANEGKTVSLEYRSL